jgi:hypothetical protein
MSDGFDGTTITRAGSRDRFTVVHNRTIEDDRLSFRALGLLVFVLSKPDNWKTHVNHLSTTHSEGREAVRSALTELETCGYVERRWVRGVGEATPSVHYLVSELPGCPEIGNPGNRDAQKPATSNEGSKEVVKTDSQTKGRVKIIRPEGDERSDSELLTAAFDAFWEKYPRKVAKPAALKAWPGAVKLAGGDLRRIVKGVRRYADDANLPEKQFIPYPSKWLREGRWDDEPLPARNGNRPQAEGQFQTVVDQWQTA